MRDKQIEEIYRILLDGCNGIDCYECEGNGKKDGCLHYHNANAIYNAGYRKASDVAREVIDEFERRLYSVTHRETSITGYAYSVVDIDEIAYEAEELKKKYESEETNR